MEMRSLVRSKIYEFKALNIAFLVFIALYALLFLIQPNLGPTDDFVFLKTLQEGKPLLYYGADFPYYDTLGIGRFTPLASLEYNIFLPFTSDPFWYFAYHAVQFIIFALLLIKLLKTATQNIKIPYWVTALFCFLPGFAIVWFRLQLPERNTLFFFILFLLSYAAYEKKPSWKFFLSTLLCANIAIYYKEVAFIGIGAFSLAHLMLSWKMSAIRKKALLIFTSASSFLYFTLYYFYFGTSRGSNLEGLVASNTITTTLKSILNFGLFSDPILIFLALPLLAWRFYSVFIQKGKRYPFFDAMLAGSIVYILSYFALGFYGPYYSIPAYAFALPALVFFFTNKEFLIPFKKTLLALASILIITNVLPAGIHYITYNKYLPINFNKTLDYLVENISLKQSKERANIFIDGNGRGGGRGTYFILGEFLQFKGLSPEQFNMKSYETRETPVSVSTKRPTPFTIFQSDEADTIESGDYMIVAPQTFKNADAKYRSQLRVDYNLVFTAEGTFAFPNITLKILVKTALVKNGSDAVSENFWELPNYYVYIKK